MYLIKCKGGHNIICGNYAIEGEVVRIYDAEVIIMPNKDAEDMEIAIEVIKLKSIEYIAHIENGECEEEADDANNYGNATT